MTTAAQPKVLCVDDEPRVLEGLESNLVWDYDVHTAPGGAEGLEILRDDGPFAVVISDMRMPGMDGATFLSKAREQAPETTRMLLTGFSDLDAAVRAINHGNIFRFLNKPCGPDVLLPAVEAAAHQNRLVRAERELLENTLSGSVKVLTDVLSLIAPVAFSRASCLEGYVRHMAAKLGLSDAWQYELAALLSQIGCITIPPDTLDKAYVGQELTQSEARMLRSHPSVGRDLLCQVPRLEQIAEMIAGQNTHFDQPPTLTPATKKQQVDLGAALIRLAKDVDQAVLSGQSMPAVLQALRKADDGHDAVLLESLADYELGAPKEAMRVVRVRDLQILMVFDEDVCSANGNVIVPQGREVTRALIERLKNFARGMGVVEPIRVRVPVG